MMCWYIVTLSDAGFCHKTMYRTNSQFLAETRSEPQPVSVRLLSFSWARVSAETVRNSRLLWLTSLK